MIQSVKKLQDPIGKITEKTKDIGIMAGSATYDVLRTVAEFIQLDFRAYKKYLRNYFQK